MKELIVNDKYNEKKLIPFLLDNFNGLNINIGLKYFTYLLNHYNNNYPLAIIAYNAGMGRVDKWIKEGTIKQDGSDLENIPFKETNLYVRKVLNVYEKYKNLY